MDREQLLSPHSPCSFSSPGHERSTSERSNLLVAIAASCARCSSRLQADATNLLGAVDAIPVEP